MLQQITIAVKLVLGSAAMPFGLGFAAILVTGLLLRRSPQWPHAIVCGLVCVLVQLAGALSGIWQEGSLLGYGVVVASTALYAAMTNRP
jgi:hypothetical protein